ncbi:hypothetical protein C2857_005162 [Epichloe festucae Fl1]|uniref:Uncharacterized protein n=1 Tax=Epichloe festucae (strain Fl1) TaxID=877507 RepID=A0A7U3SPG4_EPIFF|nr:hypothetical protein C2857_005162 [Epichloe festucae Fl1]
MRFLLTLSYVYVASALALATHPIKFNERSDNISLELAAQSTHGENALAPRGQTKTALKNPLERRRGFTALAHIPFDDPNPRHITIGGVTITFMMAHDWYLEGSKLVQRFVCKGIKVANSGVKTVQVNVIAAGQFLMRNFYVGSQELHEAILLAYNPAPGQTCTIDVDDEF